MATMRAELRQAYQVCAKSLIEGRIDVEDAEDAGFHSDAPAFTVGQTAELANIHPQTLRQYDRLGLIVPQRTIGGARRYSLRDVQRLAQAQQLSQNESINLAGITRILSLMEENRQLRRQIKRLRRTSGTSVFAAGRDGEMMEFPTGRSTHGWRSGLYETLQLTASASVSASATSATSAASAESERTTPLDPTDISASAIDFRGTDGSYDDPEYEDIQEQNAEEARQARAIAASKALILWRGVN